MSSICAVLLGSLGWMYWQKVQEYKQVSEELTTIRAIIAKPYSSPKVDLEAKIAHRQEELASLKSYSPNYRQSLRVNKILFELAEATGVRLFSLATSLSGGEKQPNFSLALSLQGDVRNILDFIAELNGVLPTAEVISTDILPKEGQGAQAGLKIQIHTR